MDDSPEVIRLQMEETRASLTEKLETLEHQVSETVHDARAAVTDTVATVKEAVHETVETVKETFDINRQMERHPWAMLGGSIALGFLGTRLLERLDPDPPYSGNGHGPDGSGRDWPRDFARETYPDRRITNGAAPAHDAHPDSDDDGPSLLKQFEPEIAKLKGMAVGAFMGVMRDMISGSIPDPLKPQVTDVINNLTTKLGGEPVRGQLLKSV